MSRHILCILKIQLAQTDSKYMLLPSYALIICNKSLKSGSFCFIINVRKTKPFISILTDFMILKPHFTQNVLLNLEMCTLDITDISLYMYELG